MRPDQPIKRFKRITTALVSAIMTVSFCVILEGIKAEALEESTIGEIAITAEILPEGLQALNTEITFKVNVVGEGIAPFDYEIEYGDEESDSVTKNEETYSFKHKYSAAGNFEITILVMDEKSKSGIINMDYQVSASTPAKCGDLLDNDKDGLTDYPEDVGCQSASDNDESNATLPQCSNFIDDDKDGLTDYGTGIYEMLSDPGCSSKEDNTENSDNVDGAGDGAGDNADGNGSNNGSDGDGDGLGNGDANGDSNTDNGSDNTGSGNQGNQGNQGNSQGGTLGYTPQNPNQSQATLNLQNSMTGDTAGTGPGVLIYFAFPALAMAYQQVRNALKRDISRH